MRASSRAPAAPASVRASCPASRRDRSRAASRVLHLRQVLRAWPRAEVMKCVVTAWIATERRDRLVVEAAELDRRCGARVLAGGRDLARSDLAMLDARADLCASDPLHAVRALLHDATRAHRDLGVVLFGVGLVLEPVEPAH